MSLYRKNDVTVGHHGIIRLLFSSMIDGTGANQISAGARTPVAPPLEPPLSASWRLSRPNALN